jgi:catechol 2,3-dioxygenase-like lactoylglutathione lyase family enzyme
MRVTRFDHSNLHGPNIDRVVEFFTELLDFSEAAETPGRAADIVARYDIPLGIGPTRHGITRGQTIYFVDLFLRSVRQPQRGVLWRVHISSNRARAGGSPCVGSSAISLPSHRSKHISR